MTIRHTTLLFGWLYNQITAERDEGSWGVSQGTSPPSDPLCQTVPHGPWRLLLMGLGQLSLISRCKKMTCYSRKVSRRDDKHTWLKGLCPGIIQKLLNSALTLFLEGFPSLLHFTLLSPSSYPTLSPPSKNTSSPSTQQCQVNSIQQSTRLLQPQINQSLDSQNSYFVLPSDFQLGSSFVRSPVQPRYWSL